ncbi:MAG: L,D-transpeptidase family protein [Anaerocolumna sp.]
MLFKKANFKVLILLCLVLTIIGSMIFTNKSSAKTEIPYYIKVNKQQNCVTIYEKDKNGKYTVPVKSMVCSVGVATPIGVFKTPIKYRWKLLMGDVWGQYSTRIVGGILFHSVWYYKLDASTLSATQYNKLGTTASHGCVRLTVADAKWIYDNCPIGTTVEIYNSKDPGPLGKPEAVKLPAGTGWDPTDPSTSNPFLKKTPSITGVADKSIAWGSKIDLLKGAKAKSTMGVDITKDIVVKGNVNIYKSGVYQVKYSVTDLLGKTTSKTISLTVKKTTKNPVIKGVTDKVVGTDTVIDRAFALKGVTAYLSSKKLSSTDIKVTIEKPTEDQYTITYYIKAPNKKSTTVTSTVSIDTTPPKMTGIYFKELTKDQFIAGKEEIMKLALQGLEVTDDYSKLTSKDVIVGVEPINDYAYQITYEVSDEVGNSLKESVQFAYFKDVRIEGVLHVYDIPYGTLIDETFVKRGILAANGENEDYTDRILVDITSSDSKHYLVTYSVQNGDGSMVSLTCNFVMSDEVNETNEEEMVDQTVNHTSE